MQHIIHVHAICRNVPGCGATTVGPSCAASQALKGAVHVHAGELGMYVTAMASD